MAVGDRGNPLGEGLACGRKWITLDQCQYLQGYKWVITDAYSVVDANTQFSSVTQSCLPLCNSKDCSTPGFLVHHQLAEFTQTHVH